MARRDIIVIGASAGGVESLKVLVAALPPGLRAAVFVVLHLPPFHRSLLSRIFNSAGFLPATQVVNATKIELGRIYVAPPDYHLLIRQGFTYISHGPRENAARPAIDPLFRSAAHAYGPRVIGVVLSGNLDDGSIGLGVIKARSGVCVVQDPADALYPSMPSNAIKAAAPDHVVPIGDMAALLTRLVDEEVEAVETATVPEAAEAADADDPALRGPLAEEGGDTAAGIAQNLMCPACGGPLTELSGQNLLRFACYNGHSYSPHALFDNMSDHVESALWSAIVALEDRARLSARLAQRARSTGIELTAERFEANTDDAWDQAAMLRQLLLRASNVEDIPED